MRPATWRAVHWLAYLSWPVAMAHTFGMGTDAGERWVIVLGVVCVLAVWPSRWGGACAPPYRQASARDRPRIGPGSAAQAPPARRAHEGLVTPMA